MYAVGRELDERQWRAVLRQLVAIGHVRVDSEAFGALKLNESARGVLRGETGVMLREWREGTPNRAIRAKSHRGNLVQASSSQGTGDAHFALQVALRAWRTDVARKRGVPAYVVLHDSTIDGIAVARPTTLDKLRGIAGIGDKKLEHYGAELIALVKQARA